MTVMLRSPRRKPSTKRVRGYKKRQPHVPKKIRTRYTSMVATQQKQQKPVDPKEPTEMGDLGS
jgi:hypothetical protein